MTVTKASEKILKYLASSFIETGNEFSCGEVLAEQFPDIPIHILHAAIAALNSDGFITVLYAENAPQEIALLIDGILHCDENTMLRRGYSTIKEIRSWF